MSELTPIQRGVLGDLVDGSFYHHPFPPMQTMRALKRRQYIEVHRSDDSRLFIVATEKGREALEDANAEIARNCANWEEGECQTCGVQWQYFAISPSYRCPHFAPRTTGGRK